ncbi:hypothetical protein BT69DRAFT_1318508 [Atractiella rhizophila]|nr:hypothetical protein BT69DRAFT_1318508 [Atractiella rhizophila]
MAEVLNSFFVEALYDYSGVDTSSLSFREGDIIEVLTQLDSGWWDGVICAHKERGWFPSNYVARVPEERWPVLREHMREWEEQESAESADSGGVNGQSMSEEEGGRATAESLGEREAQQQLNRLMGFGGSESYSDEEGFGNFSSGGNVFGELAAAAAARSTYHRREDSLQYASTSGPSNATRGYEAGSSSNSRSRGNSRVSESDRRHAADGYYQQQQQRQVQPTPSSSSKARKDSRASNKPSSSSYKRTSSQPQAYFNNHRPRQDVEDFWIPRTTSDGQIVYENQQTGEISRDLPLENDYLLNSSNTSLAYTSSHPSDSNTESSGRKSSVQHSPLGQTSFIAPGGHPQQEVWTSKTTDDGTAIFYESSTTGEVRWAPPEGAVIVGVVQTRSPGPTQPATLRNNSSTSLSNKRFEAMGNRSRSHSLAQSNESGSSSARRSSNFLHTNASSLPSTSRSSPTPDYEFADLKRLSHYSTGSLGSEKDFKVKRRASSRRSRSTLEAPRVHSRTNAADVLEPAPPLTLGELEMLVTSSINDLLAPSRMKESSADAENPYFEDESAATLERNKLAAAIDSVVANVRSLLHAAGVGEGAVGAPFVSLAPNEEPTSRSSLTGNGLVARTPLLSQAAMNELRQCTITVISTLSKLVLSVRAVWGLLETISRDHKVSDEEDEGTEGVVQQRRKLLIDRRQNENKLRSDIFRSVKELADAVVVFTQEYERVAAETLGNNVVLHKGRLQAPKRIQGVLVTSAGALILPGGGYGGNWRGNGFVTLPALSPVLGRSTTAADRGLVYEYPSKPLSLEVVDGVELKQKEVEEVIQLLIEKLQEWIQSLRTSAQSQKNEASTSNDDIPPSPMDSMEALNLSRDFYPAIADTSSNLLSALGKFLNAAEDVDIANKVDLEMDTEVMMRLNRRSVTTIPISENESEDAITDSQASEYRVVTQQAKPLLYDFEKYKQALYNSAPSLMFSVQGLSLAISRGQTFYEPDEVDSVAQPPATAPLSDVIAPKQGTSSPHSVLAEVKNMESSLSAFINTLKKLREIADAQDAAPRRLRRESIAFRESLADMHSPKALIAQGNEAVGLDVESLYEKDSDSRSSADSTFFIGNPAVTGPPPPSTSRNQARSSSIIATQSPYDRRGSLAPTAPGAATTAFGHRSDISVSSRSGFEAKSPQKKKRLEALLGPDYTPNAVVNPPLVQEEAVPWFLGKDYTDEDISFSMEGGVKGGNLQALVAFLTSHEGRPDSQFLFAFLMTFQTFCTPFELLDLLAKRYLIEPPPELTTEEVSVWTEKKQKLIRPRVINVIKTWIESYLPEDTDTAVLQSIASFTETQVHDQTQKLQVVRALEKRDTKRDRGGSVPLGPPPPAIWPKNPRKLKFLDIDALEMARQLTIMDSLLFRKITPRDCLSKAWPKKYGTDPINFKAITDMSVFITRWVEKTVLQQEDVRKRTATIKHFITIADRCRALNNYATFFYIVAGLQSTAVHRLKRTWDTVNAKNMQAFDAMTKLVNPEKNFGAYRETLRRVTPPCVPFLGVYLSDWTFIGDGSADMLRDKPDHINFNKRQKAAELILAIQLHQQVSYNLVAVDPIVRFINDNIKEPESEQVLYEMSISLEPREREDEKIARLLQEAFL